MLFDELKLGEWLSDFWDTITKVIIQINDLNCLIFSEVFEFDL
jgi:hypothetical protein